MNFEGIDLKEIINNRLSCIMCISESWVEQVLKLYCMHDRYCNIRVPGGHMTCVGHSGRNIQQSTYKWSTESGHNSLNIPDNT